MPRTPKPAPAAQPPPAVWKHIDELTPWADNPRKNDPAVPALVRSVLRFGFPTVCTEDAATGMLTAGHTRVKALRAILTGKPRVTLDDGTPLKRNAKFTLAGAPGPGFVPVRVHRFASPAEARAYALADNRLGELSEWDDDKLKAAVADILAGDDGGDIAFDGAAMLHDAGFADDDPVMAAALADLQRDAATPGPVKTPTGAHASPDTGAGASGAAEDQTNKLALVGFHVVIECDDDAHQRDVLAWCMEKGLRCRALI